MSNPTILELAYRLAKGEVTARILVQQALARIAQTNGRWRVFIAIDADRALAAAEVSDARIGSGQALGPLDGIPFAVKDNLDAEGFVTTNGARGVSHPETRDAVVVDRLRQAGAILLGKLNMDEGALGATTNNVVWGRCENPAWPGHTPGGSSGGSAAAIAAGIVPFTLGTDTMGSVRIPAAYCGLWGLKPTFGLLSRRGLSVLSTSLDTIGPLAQSPEDLEVVLDAIAGFDRADHDSIAAPPHLQHHDTPASLSKVVFGVPDILDRLPIEPAVRDGFEILLGRLRGAGAPVRPIETEDWQPTQARRAGLLVLEAEGSVRLGPQFDSGASPYSETFKSMISFGRRAPGEKLAASYQRIARLRAATLRSLRDCDVILMPSAPQEAFLHGTSPPTDQADLTALANFSGCPALTFPHPFGKVRPASSTQLLGEPFSERRLLAIAKWIRELS